MADEGLHQPHDKLFKAGFGDPPTAAAFLSTQLPAALTAAIDWPRPRLEPGSFVDSQYRQSESDLLFSAPIGGREGRIYLLFEHQRVCDSWLALRLLRYMVRILGELSRESSQERLAAGHPARGARAECGEMGARQLLFCAARFACGGSR